MVPQATYLESLNQFASSFEHVVWKKPEISTDLFNKGRSVHEPHETVLSDMRRFHPGVINAADFIFRH